MFPLPNPTTLGTSAATGAADNAGQYPALPLGFKSGRYYVVTAAKTETIATTAIAANQLVYCPLYISSNVKISAIYIMNSSASQTGFNFRIGIYTNDGGLPGELVFGSAQITLDANAAVREIAVAQALAKGWYWGAVLSDSALSFYGVTSTNLIGGTWGAVGHTDGNMSSSALIGAQTTIAQSYGALPQTAPVPTATTYQSPAFGIKVA